MSLTLAGRLFHNAVAAVLNDLSPRGFFVFLLVTAVVVLQRNEAGIGTF